MTTSLSAVPDHILVRRLDELVAQDRNVEADLVLHLGEVDARALHLELGFPSMFSYCTEALHLSEATAYHRIQAARAARAYPAILDRLRCGEIHLTGVKLLAPHLTPSNHVELLDLARHKSKRAIEELLADRAPKPDAPSFVRRLPAPPALRPEQPVAVAVIESAETGSQAVPSPSPPVRSIAPEPLGQDRFKIQFTASGALREKLQEAQALLRHQLPDGDLAEIFDRALTLLLQDTKRRKFAQTSRPSRREGAAKRDADDRRASRYIPAGIKRAVVARDQGRCAYVSRAGRRCNSPDQLEFHHRRAWARLKRHSLGGIELRCRAHNHHAAVQDFGAEHMACCRAKARVEASPPTGPGASWRETASHPGHAMS
jgi:hypothetical protein